MGNRGFVPFQHGCYARSCPKQQAGFPIDNALHGNADFCILLLLREANCNFMDAKLSSGAKGGEFDEDNAVITMNADIKSAAKDDSSANHGGFSLDLESVAERKDNGPGFAGEEKLLNAAETPVMIVFLLPDGSQDEKEFKMGQTIEVLKAHVESEYGIPMNEQQLYIESEGGANTDKPLIDPLSLCDYPLINPSKGEVYIRVEGELGEDAKK